MTSILRTLVQALVFSVAAKKVFGVEAPLYKDIDNMVSATTDLRTCPVAIAVLAYKGFEPGSIQLDHCRQSLKEKVVKAIDLEALHLAVMGRNIKGIVPLAEMGANVDARDFQGYTPLHHAAMGADKAAIDTLLGLKADPTLRTNYGATYMDFLRMNAPFAKHAIPLNETLLSTHKNEKYHQDPHCVEEDVTFVNENVARPETLIDLWHYKMSDLTEEEIANLKKTNPRGVENLLRDNQKYSEYKAHPPQLSVKLVTHDDNGNPVGATFCGLFAEQDIKQKDIITEYVGELLTQDQTGLIPASERTYLFNEHPAVDAQKYRGLGAIAKDSFPNAIMMRIDRNSQFKYGIDGLLHRKILVALCNIKKGEQIVFDHGPTHPTKRIQRIEFRSKAMVEFFQNNSWKDILNKYKDVSRQFDKYARQEYVDAEMKLNQLIYVLNTPGALNLLAINRLFGSRDLEAVKEALVDPHYSKSLKMKLEKAMPHLEAAVNRAPKMKNRAHDEL